MALEANVRNGIDAVSTSRSTAQEARQRQPEAAPHAIQLDCLQPIFRARRPVAALAADQRLKRVAVDVDRRLQERLRNPAHGIKTNDLRRRHGLAFSKAQVSIGTQDRSLSPKPANQGVTGSVGADCPGACGSAGAVVAGA